MKSKIVLVSLPVFALAGCSQQKPAHPNLILAGDLGFGDVIAYGCSTPLTSV